MDNQTITSYIPAKLGTVRHVSPISVGMSGASVYAVDTDIGAYVVRRFHGSQPEWLQSRKMHQYASDLGIAPEVLSYDDAAQVLIVRRIEAVSFGAAASDPQTRDQAFAQLLIRLRKMQHAPSADGSYMEASVFATKIWQEQSKRQGFPGALELGSNLSEAQSILANDARRVFCHGDLNPANILWGEGRVWIVDWDRASNNHPFLDLAIIANFLSLPEQVGVGCLQGLLGAVPSASDCVMFAAVRNLACIVYGAVFLGLVPDLTAVQFVDPAQTKTLFECFALTTSGAVSMASPEGAAMIGAAFFKQALGSR